jgi:hypothetical protein
LPWHAYLGLVRTLDILADPELGPAVRRGMTQASGGMSDMVAAGEEGLDRVLLTPQAQADLAAANSGRSGARLLKSLASLHRSKEEAATLAGPLAGCFCCDVVGEHFRIIYNPDLGGGRLAVLAIGRLKHGGERNAEKLLEPNL